MIQVEHSKDRKIQSYSSTIRVQRHDLSLDYEIVNFIL